MISIQELTISIQSERAARLEADEDQIVGRLFRELLKFEYQVDNEKNRNAMQYIVDKAFRNCQDIGSDCRMLEAFVKRLNAYTIYDQIKFNY